MKGIEDILLTTLRSAYENGTINDGGIKGAEDCVKELVKREGELIHKMISFHGINISELIARNYSLTIRPYDERQWIVKVFKESKDLQPTRSWINSFEVICGRTIDDINNATEKAIDGLTQLINSHV